MSEKHSFDPDDPPSADWPMNGDGDTDVDLSMSDLREFEADAVTPSVPGDALPGFELGRHRGRADVLHAVRAWLSKEESNSEEWIDEVVLRLGLEVGVRWL